MAETDRENKKEGLSALTLAIASCASMAAAIFIHEIWTGGAILGAAFTPVIVALVNEGLKRPARAASALADEKLKRERAAERAAAYAAGDEAAVPPTGVQESEAAGTRDADRFGIWQADRPGWRERLSGRRLKVALGTGLLAALIGVVALTGIEMVFGSSVGSGEQRTTIFRGGDAAERDTDPVTTEPVPRQRDLEQQQPGAPAPAPGQPQQTQPAPAPQEPAPQEPAPQQPAPQQPAPQQPAPGGTPAPPG
jgi:hypothetical protein